MEEDSPSFGIPAAPIPLQPPQHQPAPATLPSAGAGPGPATQARATPRPTAQHLGLTPSHEVATAMALRFQVSLEEIHHIFSSIPNPSQAEAMDWDDHHPLPSEAEQIAADYSFAAGLPDQPPAALQISAARPAAPSLSTYSSALRAHSPSAQASPDPTSEERVEQILCQDLQSFDPSTTTGFLTLPPARAWINVEVAHQRLMEMQATLTGELQTAAASASEAQASAASASHFSQQQQRCCAQVSASAHRRAERDTVNMLLSLPHQPGCLPQLQERDQWVSPEGILEEAVGLAYFNDSSLQVCFWVGSPLSFSGIRVPLPLPLPLSNPPDPTPLTQEGGHYQ